MTLYYRKGLGKTNQNDEGRFLIVNEKKCEGVNSIKKFMIKIKMFNTI